MTEVGTEVMAIREADHKNVYYYGEGVYAGDFHPNTKAFAGFPPSILNPRIDLSDGKTVWGYECWWGPAKEIKARFPNSNWVKVDIDVDRGDATQPQSQQESQS